MDQCPLCLNKQASSTEMSDGFGGGSVTTISSVSRISCPDCGEYEITGDAITFLKRDERVRQRAMTNLRKRDRSGQVAGEREILRVTSDLLQGYWKGNTLGA